MDAAVGSSSCGDLDRLVEEQREGGFQAARDGARRRLPLKAAELRPVVLDGQAKGG
jgi:hypothetical protein